MDNFNKLFSQLMIEKKEILNETEMYADHKKSSMKEYEEVFGYGSEEIMKAFKKLKLGVPVVSRNKDIKRYPKTFSFRPKSNIPVKFPNGTIGPLLITIADESRLYVSIWNQNRRADGAYSSIYDLDHLEALDALDVKKFKMLDIVKKKFPKATLSGRHIDLGE